MKIEPFERFVGDDQALSYIGIRADENRDGYISTKRNINPVFPFIQDGIAYEDVDRILKTTVGWPKYYDWRDRSGCYFCFFQRRKEWLALRERHPDLFEVAMRYETDKEGYTWIAGMTLQDLVDRASKTLNSVPRGSRRSPEQWQGLLRQEDEADDPDTSQCLICSL